MATGTELFIGFLGKEKIDEVATSLGLQIKLGDDIKPEEILNQINADLKGAWRDAITELGLEVIGEIPNRPLFIVRNPIRDQEMLYWRLELNYDPYEMGDEPEHAILGVSLISRYSPVFLDWAKPHGGSGDIITLDSRTMINIHVAWKHIEKVMPIFNKAEIHIKELHY